MLKQLLSDNRIFSALVCVLVFIAGGLLYLQVVKSQARRDIQSTQKIVEQRYTPQTGETAPQTTTGGHYHADGTYHVGSHEAHSPSADVQTEASRRVDTEVAPGTPRVFTPRNPATPHLSGTPETASTRKLDPQTQLKVNKLYADAERLSAEAGMWSNQLYAESQELLKENEAIKAEIEKRRQMRRDPNVDKATYKAFDEALDARVRAATAEAIRLNDRYIENRERRAEAMRLRAESRALGGNR